MDDGSAFIRSPARVQGRGLPVAVVGSGCQVTLALLFLCLGFGQPRAALTPALRAVNTWRNIVISGAS